VEFGRGILVGRLAATDCEAIHGGLLRQPVNAITSLALLAVGVWILSRGAHQPPESRGEHQAFGVAMTAVGVGSFLLHGPAPAGAWWFHDLSNLAVLLLVTVLNVGLLRRWSLPARLVVVAVVVGMLGLWLAHTPTWTTPIAFVLAPAAAVAQLAVIRFGFRPRPTSERRRIISWLVALVSISFAGVAFLLGREGAPFCDPQSALQLHGLWHVLVAVAAAAFATVAFEHAPSDDGRRAHERPLE
jgi:hypothetical protein